ncbi:MULTISPECIES: SMP-30/gluconolactonase/LRE family protein [unclassified Sinorhizobium]|uniref:SMP-30/gluconolactonase/LRE family protein n=1 Tax=unclassified Sinorhizobium TaxID=2613772 RepID=UPI0024C2F376|nr:MULTISPECIES: SMP-30/gluconolactonase/LRE family protein [unclassified Sinorhizobium]MDK1377293.1 SMP-30/gluconolactonase/LRE family protein [Sinorhizobium sp. 6-70]MDK1481904.1 SMP-30/gluconolactonase/LRE family protein [Sinorhizobium sp. 6-117]
MRVLRPRIERLGSYTARIGESAIWDEQEGALLWVDIAGCKVLRTRPGSGETESWDFPEMTGFVQPADDGTWLVGQHDGVLKFDPANGTASVFTELEPAGSGNRTNDAACDRQGRLWVGTMPLPQTGLTPVGNIHVVGSDGGTATIERGLTVPNGIAFSPDGHTVYWADTILTPHQVWRAHYDPDTGRPEGKETFVVFPEDGGRPDGAAVDAAGCYWVAAVRGSKLLRFTPEGKLDLAVPLPVARPSKVAFGGSDLKTLFVTSISEGLAPEAHAAEPLAGALLALDLGIEGLPATRFRTGA